MAKDYVSRRTALKMTGAAATTAVVAGCSSDGDDGDNGDDSGIAIDPDTRIVLNGQTAGWEGKEPAAIEGESNPALELQDGEEYEIGWDEGDGSPHNIEIRNDDGDVVDDLSTEEVSDPDEDQFLTFTANSEMSSYVCAPHQNSMDGDIVVE